MVYLKLMIDPMDEYQDADTACCSFLLELVLYRRKTTFQPIIEFIHHHLVLYANAPQDQKNHSQQEGVLVMLGDLADVILDKKSPIKSQMESVLTGFVAPLLQSSVGFIRSRVNVS